MVEINHNIPKKFLTRRNDKGLRDTFESRSVENIYIEE